MTLRTAFLNLAILASLPLSAQTNVSWSGAAVDQQWNNPLNWNLSVIPCNSGVTEYNAFLGGGAGTVFMPSTCTLEFLELQLGAEIQMNNGVSLTIRDGATNNGVITPNSSGSSTGLSITDSSGDDTVTIAGLGEVVLSHTNDLITGTVNDIFHNGGGHTIRGYGQIGTNTLHLINSGSIIADSFGNALSVDPRTTFTHDGDLVATDGGILQLQSGTYNVHPTASQTQANDNSEIQFHGLTMNGGSLDAGNTDSDLSNNRFVVALSSTISGTRNQAWLVINNARSLTVQGADMTNNGRIIPEGSTGVSSISFTDTTDNTIGLGGSGRIVLDNALDQVIGAVNHTLIHNAPHLIEGGGILCGNTINFVNHSDVTANNAGVLLDIDPRSTWDNDGGTLTATSGATARLNAAEYTCLNGGRFLIGDGSEIQLAGTAMVDGIFDVDNQNGTLADNILHVTFSSSLDGGTNNATLDIDNARTLTLNGGDFTNNATITLNGSTGTSAVSIADTSDNQVRILGAGSIQLDNAFDHIGGTTNHTLVHGASHTIEGPGTVGTNTIQIVNHGLIQSHLNGGTLILDPRDTFTNDGGTLQAVNGGIISFGTAVYSPLNGGKFLLGDNCRFDLNAVTFQNLVLDVIDTDLDIANNLAHVVTSSTFTDVTNEANLHIDNARILSIHSGDLTNNATITLDGATGDSSLSIHDTSDLQVQLLGTGTVFLDDPLRDKITGTSNHVLVHGENHTIEGPGAIGTNTIQIVNHGLIRSNLSGQTLTIDPRDTFLNDGGTVEAVSGGIINFGGGTYSPANGGEFLLGDDCRFDLTGVTFQDVVLEVVDLDLDRSNNLAHVTLSSTFTDVTNETNLHVDNVRTLNIHHGDLTNNASITLDGSTGDSSLSFHDPSDLQIQLLGTGTVFLDDPLRDKLTGTSNHTLIHGANHTIEGSGPVGTNTLQIVNHGLIHANLPGQALTLDPRSTFLNDGGRLHASNGATVALGGGTYSSANGGDYRIFDGAAFTLNGLTLTNLTLEADNLDATLDNNLARMTFSSIFSDVTNNTKITIDNSRTLTITPGDLVNNGIIELDSTGSNTSVAMTGTGDLLVSIGGTGRIVMDQSTEFITGTINHVLRHEAGHTIEGAGNVCSGSIHLDNRGTITANLSATPLIIDDRAGGFASSGTLQAVNNATLDINDPVSNQGGLIFAEAGATVDINGVLFQSGGTIRVDGNLVATSISMTGGTLHGTGDVDATVTANTSLISPGNSTGTLMIDGNSVFGSGSSLRIEVNATADADQLVVVGGALDLFGGALQLVYTGGPTSVLPTDAFTIVTTGGSVAGQFVNVGDGQRLTTIDGSASFVVNYGSNTVTLSDFLYNVGGATNEAPIFVTTTTNYSIDENSPVATAIASFAAYDPEGALVTYALTPGLPFAIDPNTGALTTTGPLDYETQTTYNAIVSASDGFLQTDLPITIDVNNIQETNQEVVTSILAAPGGPYPGESDLGIIGVNADPDFDDLGNIYELWRGSDPAAADQPTPLVLETVLFASNDHASVVVEVDPALDDMLAIDVEFSFGLQAWRDGSANRSVLSDIGGVRTLRFRDPDPLPVGSPFFVRFFGDPNATP